MPPRRRRSSRTAKPKRKSSRRSRSTKRKSSRRSSKTQKRTSRRSSRKSSRKPKLKELSDYHKDMYAKQIDNNITNEDKIRDVLIKALKRAQP